MRGGKRKSRCNFFSYNGLQQLKNGGETRNRTADTRIFSPLLYQLSYLAPRIVSGYFPMGYE